MRTSYTKRRMDFVKFHRRNPHVYALARKLTLKVFRAGKTCNMMLVWEMMRWEYMFNTVDPAFEFKLCDHHRSFYARLLMDRNPELEGFFKIRGRREI